MARGSGNGEVTVAEMDAPPAERAIALDLTLEEARGLMELASSSLLEKGKDGQAPGGVGAKSAVGKLREQLEEVQRIAAVRAELEQAGFQTKHLSDDEVAALGRRIAEIPHRSR